ncbi:Ribosome biogenesis protein ytm1 [Penicillium rolfsii]|nr:Ribosome biogenesis protein ytm1 [Penicillium rolfsii]
MPPSEGEVCQAVLSFVTDGTYPEENVVAAEFPATALAKELELISQAREQVENEISSLSRENTTFDADDWIDQAKQLHADIERSRVTAREIVAQHEHTSPLQSKVEDASAKMRLIETEIAFNQAVAETLEEVQRLHQRLENGRAALSNGHLMVAIEQLESTIAAIRKDAFFTKTNVMSILTLEVARFREQIEGTLRQRWQEQLRVDRQGGKFQVIKGDGANSLDNTMASMSRLEILSSATEKLLKDICVAVLDPILLPRTDGKSRSVAITDTGICIQSEFSETTVAETLSRTTEVLDYLRQNLPPSILAEFPQSLIPSVASKAISGWLSSSIPTTLDGLGEFEETLDTVLQFTNTIKSWGWSGIEELVSWVNQAPRLWLTRRRVDSLDSVRKVLAASQGTTKQVERVEKEQVSRADEALLETATDDWDASWDDDKEEDSTANPATAAQPEDEEEDVSAWGLDEDAQEEAEPHTADPSGDDEADGDAWGWGEDEGEEEPSDQKKSLRADTTSKPVHGGKAVQSPAPREMTLREIYTVTDIPDSILDIVRQQINDSKDISQPPHSTSRVASSGAGLLALPTLILAMFKATSSSFYSLKLGSGQMYLYNDSLYLAGQIRQLIEEHELSRLSSDVEALEKFGKFAYSKEMQTQSTIVTDLLDGAQGFAQCSEQPFKTECENAVSATSDRIRDVYKEWQPILSHSALLQSIGSLLSTVISKIIVDVVDLGDISEDQSKQLVALCNHVSKLEDLFMPETNGNAEALPVTAVYVPNWLRFQYFINILESSLADIKYLWLEGELGLEFTVDEVVDLIEALFAESGHRRQAISEIKPTRAEIIHHNLDKISPIMSGDLEPTTAEAVQRQVRVQLTTQQEDIALPESTGPILVPTGLRRYALSTLVNNLLGSEKPIPFEFLINGTFLRTSIDEYLTDNGISAETTLEIEYVRALIPPLHIASFQHDDWVSATDVLSSTSHAASWASGATFSKGQERILSGSYDGLLRIWNMSSEIIATSPAASEGGHTASIKAAKFVSPNQIASAGLDRTVRLWKYTEDDELVGKITPQLELYGHKSGIESLAVHAPSNRLLTGSSDHNVGFWSTKKADAPAAPENLLPNTARTLKRRKLNTSVSTPQRGPLALLSAHTGPVSAAIFDAKDSTVGYSASWDHSLRTWDLVTAALVDTRTTSHSLLSLEHLPEHSLLAAGTSARHITLIDPRASATTVAAMTLRGHTNAVVTLARDPSSTYGLISGSHDGTCRIWDIRSTKNDKEGVVGESVYSIARKSLEEEGKVDSKRVGGEGVKVFSVCWDQTIGIVSAGEDKRIQINRGEGVLSSNKE